MKIKRDRFWNQSLSGKSNVVAMSRTDWNIKTELISMHKVVQMYQQHYQQLA